MFAGVVARGTGGGFQIATSLSFDGSKANTDRTLFAAARSPAIIASAAGLQTGRWVIPLHCLVTG